MVSIAVLLALPHIADAQDRILLQEVLPILDGTRLGAIELGDAPPPGASRIVRRSEVRAALRRAGHDPRGLAIPRAVRVRRPARELGERELARIARGALVERLAPCRVSGEVRVPHGVRIAPGPNTVHADVPGRVRTGTVAAVLVIEAGGRETRLPVRTEVACPEPVVRPGTRVTIVVRVGNVRATAPGEARQSGRRGDVIRVRNEATRASLEARVVDGDTVEVLP